MKLVLEVIRGLPLASTQLCQALLPYFAQANLDFQPIGNLLALWRIQFRKASRKEIRKDLPKVAVDFSPSLAQRFFLVFIQASNRLLNLSLVSNDGLHHILERSFFLLHTINHVHDLRVDFFLHTLEALGQIPQRRFTFSNILAFEVIGSIGTAKTFFLVGNPLMLALHLRESLRSSLLLLLKFFYLVSKFLLLQAFFRYSGGFQSQSIFKRS